MTEFVCRRTGRTYGIGERLDADGDGAVHVVEPASAGLALKRYLPGTLQKRSDLEARVKAMIAHPPAYRADGSGRVSCAWPEDIAFVSDRFAGFVMPRVDVREARTVHDVAMSHGSTFADRVAVAENLARVVALLHDGDVVVGDFHEQNLLAGSDGHVTLLGCDRMQVVDPAAPRRFPCLARHDGFAPPELWHSSLSSTLRTSSSDIFSLAVLLHLLLLREHPFQGEWRGQGATPQASALARDGLWSYADDPRLAPRPGAVPVDVLPPTLRRYFRAAFVDGARVPAQRPSAHEWVAALVDLRRSIVACDHEPDHGYGRHLSGCPWCTPDAPSPSPSPAVGSVPARRPRPAARAGVAPSAARTDAPSELPAGPAPTAARTRPLPPSPTDGRTTARPPSREPVGSARRRGRSRAAAWVAVAAVGVGAVIAVARTTVEPAPVVVGPAAADTARTAPAAPSPAPRPADPTEALEQVRSRDAATVETLAESWVAQLSARAAGSGTADRTTTDAAVLTGHDALRKQYPEAVLLWSPDWNYDGRMWVTVVNERFPTAEEANAWCDAHAFAPRDCYAKKLSHSDVVDGSARYRG